MSDIERTPLANGEYRAKTGEILKSKMSIIGHILDTLGTDTEVCECDHCVERWEELG